MQQLNNAPDAPVPLPALMLPSGHLVTSASAFNVGAGIGWGLAAVSQIVLATVASHASAPESVAALRHANMATASRVAVTAGQASSGSNVKGSRGLTFGPEGTLVVNCGDVP